MPFTMRKILRGIGMAAPDISEAIKEAYQTKKAEQLRKYETHIEHEKWRKEFGETKRHAKVMEAEAKKQTRAEENQVEAYKTLQEANQKLEEKIQEWRENQTDAEIKKELRDDFINSLDAEDKLEQASAEVAYKYGAAELAGDHEWNSQLIQWYIQAMYKIDDDTFNTLATNIPPLTPEQRTEVMVTATQRKQNLKEMLKKQLRDPNFKGLIPNETILPPRFKDEQQLRFHLKNTLNYSDEDIENLVNDPRVQQKAYSPRKTFTYSVPEPERTEEETEIEKAKRLKEEADKKRLEQEAIIKQRREAGLNVWGERITPTNKWKLYNPSEKRKMLEAYKPRTGIPY